MPGLLVSDVIDRTFDDFLYPAGVNRPQYEILSGAIASAAVPGTGGTFDLLGTRLNSLSRNALLEIDEEIVMQRTNASGPPITVTVQERGYGQSVAAAHADGSIVRVGPDVFRIQVFNKIKTAIGLLWGTGIYRRTVKTDATFRSDAVINLDANTRRVISIRARTSGASEQWRGLMRPGYDYEFLRDVDPPQVQLWRGGVAGAAMRIVEARDFERPATTATDLDTCGLTDEIQEGLPMLVAGLILMGREPARLDIEEIRRLLSAAGAQVQVGAHLSVGRAFIDAFRQLYVANEKERLKELDPHDFEYVGA